MSSGSSHTHTPWKLKIETKVDHLKFGKGNSFKKKYEKYGYSNLMANYPIQISRGMKSYSFPLQYLI